MNEHAKGCATCRFKRSIMGEWICGRTDITCRVSRSIPHNSLVACDANFSGWAPKRSLRQWLYDTFWRKEAAK